LNKNQISPEVLEALRRFDSPTISNVIELFDVRPHNTGYIDSTIKALFPEIPPIVGFASTAKFRASRPAEKGSRATLKLQIEGLEKLPRPRIVVFEDLDSPPAAATFGEVMCSVYQRFGCVGLINSGAGRDLDAVRNLGFAAFASSVCASHGYSHSVDLHVPVTVGGLVIHPGDLIHADVNGIVVIPAEIAAQVAETCPAYIKSEGVILSYLKSKQVDVEGLQCAFNQHIANTQELSSGIQSRGRKSSTKQNEGLV
jgi:4-hydroxy-4-methyl-2-oxoglutarate aldolase